MSFEYETAERIILLEQRVRHLEQAISELLQPNEEEIVKVEANDTKR